MSTASRTFRRGDRPTPRLTPGDAVAPRILTTITSERLRVPDPAALVHLQFRRFAGCPVCNLHLRSVARRHQEIRAAGIREVAVFHSTAESMLPHQGDLPFPAVADPGKSLYAAFGVESSPRALLDPRAWPAFFRVAFTRMPSAPGPGGALGLPADFLIGPDGLIREVKYGRRADDQWPVDELLSLAARHR
ncbi:peroxiredoxin-like family protein [Streptomyces sp. HNM0663]|uniref:Peroxiredoxin-like family protein n=1 Tax=Streptomyces chengmaiensis TaxID=3040919 RepID=A0ABT6HKM7_9ACTN|nr:peroxiredoxin-like family protein [Streptomyces chengmaiensis]MDH2389258.1 peroxiredoxin-like family protein [Streptomyces chengmaiensis]